MIGGLVLRNATSYIYKPNTIVKINPVFTLYKSLIHHKNRLPQIKDSKDIKDKIVKNESIKFPNLRVVYVDEISGKNEWKIMTRSEAIAIAKEKSLDLILGDFSILL